jgi:ribosomal protein L27
MGVGIWEGRRREKWEGFEGGAADLGRNGWPKEKALKTPNEDRNGEGGEGKEEAGAADYGSRMAKGQKIHRRPKGGRRWKKANWGIGRDWAIFTNIGLGSFFQYTHKFTPILSHNFIGSDETRRREFDVDQLNGKWSRVSRVMRNGGEAGRFYMKCWDQ